MQVCLQLLRVSPRCGDHVYLIYLAASLENPLEGTQGQKPYPSTVGMTEALSGHQPHDLEGFDPVGHQQLDVLPYSQPFLLGVVPGQDDDLFVFVHPTVEEAPLDDVYRVHLEIEIGIHTVERQAD